MLIIPTQPVPNQSFLTNLSGQAVQINVRTMNTGLYLDILISNSPIVSGVICEDRNRLVRDAYLGFVGDLIFADLQGTSDPSYIKLNSRFLLVYLETADLAAIGYSGLRSVLGGIA